MQGKTISGYTLQRLLGVGGMSEVWYAENKIGKKAAVKLLLPKLCQDENVISRFLTEAKVMVELNHPNIRQVYDYGDIDGRSAIVMEYLEGDDLKKRMKRGQRFTDEELKKWWNQLVSALNYTHQKSIVHRDIKPGNIFVDTEGNIKLLDFGIAKVRESISSTQTGQKLGTLMYMSPEQVKDSKHIDYRTDVYSLAVTFVHLLTGKKPYDSDTSSDFEISEQIVYKPLDLSGVPMEWQIVLKPFLEKGPEKRPPLKMIGETEKGSSFGGSNNEDDGTMVDAPSASSSSVKKEKPKAKTKANAKEKPKKKGKKALWITLAGIAAIAAAVLVVFNMKPSELELYPAPKDGKWGFIDKNGKFVIKPRYDRTYEFSEGYAAVEVDGLCGYINKNGEMVIPPLFSYANPFKDGMAKVNVNGYCDNYYSGQCGYIDTKGNLVIDTQFDPGGAWDFSEGVAQVLGEGGWGFIDKEGNYVIEPKFVGSSDFSEGLSAVEVRWNQYGYVDHNGSMVIDPHFSGAGNFSDGIASVKIDSLWGAIDKHGNVVIQPQYYDYFNFSEGVAAVRMDRGVGYIDKSNKVVIQPRFDWAENFSEGLAAVYVDGKWGAINKSGNWVVMPQFKEMQSFKNGLAEVWLDDYTMGYIDKTGKIVYTSDTRPKKAEKADANEEDAYMKCTNLLACYQYIKKYPNGYYSKDVHNRELELEPLEWALKNNSVTITFYPQSYLLPTRRASIYLRKIADVARTNDCELLLTGTGDGKECFDSLELAMNRCKKIQVELMELGFPASKIILNPIEKQSNIGYSRVHIQLLEEGNDGKIPESGSVSTPSSYSKKLVGVYYFPSGNVDMSKNKYNNIVRRAIRELVNSGKTIYGFEIEGYISPEMEDGNSILYANAVEKDIKSELRKEKVDISNMKFKSIGCGMLDWEQISIRLMWHDWPNSDEYESMDVHSKVKKSDNKRQTCKELFQTYPLLAREIAPTLRYVEVFAYY